MISILFSDVYFFIININVLVLTYVYLLCCMSKVGQWTAIDEDSSKLVHASLTLERVTSK